MRFKMLLLMISLMMLSCKDADTSSNDNGPVLPPRDTAFVAVEQRSIEFIDKMMPAMPIDYKLKDFKQTVRLQDQLLFDENAKGPYLPLIVWLEDGKNFNMTTFGLPSYINTDREQAEGLTCIGAVLSASLVGIDKSNQQGENYVRMLKQYYNSMNGQNLVLNRYEQGTGDSFWYEIFPSVGFFKVVDLYPSMNDMGDIMRRVADRWIDGIQILKRGQEYPDFDYTALHFSSRQPKYNGTWREPDAAAGVAWLQYMAYKKFKDEKYLKAAKECMEFLQRRAADKGAYYEILMPYGAFLASCMNAELGTQYDVDKMINYCLNGDNPDRKNWGVLHYTIGSNQMHGLVGSCWTPAPYAFAMNSFDAISTMVPIAKYMPQYARSIGRWALNNISASRLFYADESPADRQSNYNVFMKDKVNPICYEGLRGTLEGAFKVYESRLAPVGPYALGDTHINNSSLLDICPYGSSWAGELAAIVEPTNVTAILQIDCGVTDFFSGPSYHTYLYYNPYTEAKKVAVKLPDDVVSSVDIYNMNTKKFIAQGVSDMSQIEIPASQAIVITVIPSGAAYTKINGRLYGNDIIIDNNYQFGK